MDNRLFHRDLLVLSGAFFFIFLGPGAIQQHLDKIIGPKRFYVLATLYISLCFWRVFIGVTIRALGDLLSGLLGAATYVAFAATLWFSTSWTAMILAAAVWGWGAASLWITSQARLLDATKRYGASSGLFYSLLAAGHALGVGLLALIAACWLAPLGRVVGCLAQTRWAGPLAETLPWGLRDVLVATCVLLGLPGLVLICFTRRQGAPRQPFSLGGFWKIARQRPIVLIGVIQLCSSLSYGILLGVFSEISQATTSSQWPAVAFYVARVALCFPAGALADRIGKARVLKLSFLLAAAGILLAALWRSHPGVSLSICAAAMAAQNALTASNGMAMIGDVAKPAARHMALGAVFLWRDLGVVIPLFVAGLLKGLLPDAADADLVREVFYASLYGFAAVFVASAFLCEALRKALHPDPARAGPGLR